MSKNVLVTGADGFIGSHLAENLVRKGFKVRSLCIYNSNGSWGWLETSELAREMEIILGDIRDPFLCNKITQNIDCVFNLAALIAIPYSYIAPQSYVETNINGALNICQAALANQVARVVQTSTSEVYGTALYVPIDEKHPLQAQSPYSASKISSDAIALSFYNSFNLPVTVARPFNTYGPRQSARAVIPNIISQIASGKKEIMLGDVTPTRDFNFVEDTCNGIISLASTEKAVGKTVNIGSGVEVSIEALFYKIRDLMGSDSIIRKDDDRVRPLKSEVQRLLCDNSLIKSLTGFNTTFDLDKGLKETIQWFSCPKNLSMYKTEINNV